MTERDKAQPDAAESAGVSRRDFVTRTAVAGAGLVIVPRHVLGHGFQAPSDTLNIATIGVSGMGSSNTGAVLSQNIVAFCDVDFGLLDARIDQLEERGGGRGRAQTAPRAPMRQRREPTAAQVAANEKRPRSNGAENLTPLRRRAAAQDPEVSRLPRDAGQAERHRRGDHRHPRSHARQDRACGDGPRQARLRAEAALLVG